MKKLIKYFTPVGAERKILLEAFVIVTSVTLSIVIFIPNFKPNIMKLVDLYKTDNQYISNWSDDDDTIFIKGTIQPFTYKAVFTNNETEEESWCILNDIELNHLKSKL
jgi:hypothetical protein